MSKPSKRTHGEAFPDKDKGVTKFTPKIIIYEHDDYKGPHRELTEDIPHLKAIGFNDRISSIKVKDSVWIGYEHGNYKGRQYILEPGEYSTEKKWHGKDNQLTSFKKLDDDFFGQTPNIVLYQHTNFRGKRLSFEHGVERLDFYRMNDEVSALKVKTGAWVLFDDYRYTGRQHIVTEGNYSTYKGSFSNDKLSSLRPVREPKMPTEVLSMEFDITSGLQNSKPKALANFVQVNNSSSPQQASWKTSQQKSTTKTYEWHWENSTSIGVETTFSTGVPFIAEGEITMSVENTFAVGENRGSENTQSDDWSFELPATVAPKTRLRVQVIIQKGKIEVPFKAVMKRGTKRWEERGTYKGTQSYNITTEYTETPLD